MQKLLVTMKDIQRYKILKDLLEKKLKTGIRLNTDTPSVGEFTTKVRSGTTHAEITFKLLSLPLYMSSQLPRLLSSF